MIVLEQRKITEEEVRGHFTQLTKKLIEKGLTISTMESATSGQMASLLTDTEGASAIMKGAFVTYSNEAKIMQGVPKETIEEFTVYSKETALAMAKSCKKIYGADIGIGITGTMGNIDPANAEASAEGEVYFAVCYQKEQVWKKKLPVQESRLVYKLAVCELLYEAVWNAIEEGRKV